MSYYSLFPLMAAVAFIPLLITTIFTHPRQKQHRLFILLLIPSMIWSLTDFFFRSNLFPEYSFMFARIIMVVYTWMVFQYHFFNSSFYGTESRWWPVAYFAMGASIIVTALGYIPQAIHIDGNKLYPEYGTGILFIVVPLMLLAARSMYVFWKKLKYLDSPVLYNQIISLMMGLAVLTVFTLLSFLPWGREFPISHLGNIFNAFILSYATIRHRLVDIKFALRRWLVWFSLAAIGVAAFWSILTGLDNLFHLHIDTMYTAITTMVAIAIAIVVYHLRGLFAVTLNKALQGHTYDYRKELSDFADKIHQVFSLKKQGAELLSLVTRAIGCRRACLMFMDENNEGFTVQVVEPSASRNYFKNLKLESNNPIVEYLKREKAPLTRISMTVLPEFRSLWEQEREEIRSNNIELFMPLISREQLTGILVLDKKQSGRYSLEDLNLLQEVTNRVAVSMEKEYLREQLREREKELSIINRTSSIIASSLDINRTYDSFVKELKGLVDVSWTAITLKEDGEAYFLALSSEIGSAWQVGERIPISGTGTEWVILHKAPLVEADLSRESRFMTGKYHLEHGIHSIAYLPLIVKDEVIGCLIVASQNSDAYKLKHINLLESLAAHIAASIVNSRLYAKAEQSARNDGLTGLLNRRSLDELIDNEIGRHSRYGGVFCIIILDLDSFKAYNDTYGHPAGDELLKQVGRIMKSAIRGADQVFRYGGDEFAIMLPQTNIDDAYQVAERIRTRAATDLYGKIPITVSLGIASWPADGIAANQIIAAADTALYHAKRSGSNQSRHYSGALAASGEKIGRDGDETSTIFAMAAAVDARNNVDGHSKKVNEYAIALAEALNLEPLEVSRLSTCALLHDVGKIGISDEILNKPGKLNDDEWATVKGHPQLGAAIISHVRHLAPCIPGVLHHHERYDGTGYPKGLKGKDIPLEARILAIADSFAAMTSERRYSNSMSPSQAEDELKKSAGIQFDPDLVNLFLQIYRKQISKESDTKEVR